MTTTSELKKKAEAILIQSGIPLADAYGWFYQQVIRHQGLPHNAGQPNEATMRAMQEARQGKGVRYESIDEMFADMED